MRDNGPRARRKRRCKPTTDSHHARPASRQAGITPGRHHARPASRQAGITPGRHHARPVAPNLLDQDFTATAPDRKWGADISRAWTREGWPCLAVVIDLFARSTVRAIDLFAWRVVGGATGDRLHRELALAALREAPTMRRPAAGLIHPSDRGSQYCSIDHQAELKKHGILVAMSGKGNCHDNAMGERFFKTLKSELVRRTVFDTRQGAHRAIGRYIDGFCNPLRRHPALDFTSPAQFEKHAAE
jgi:putative transposase